MELKWRRNGDELQREPDAMRCFFEKGKTDLPHLAVYGKSVEREWVADRRRGCGVQSLFGMYGDS